MFTDGIIIGIRNILLVQLLIMAAAPERAVRLRQELVRIWKTLEAPVFLKKTHPVVRKGGGFWEIDMTKFDL
jgi:hypothetical protein